MASLQFHIDNLCAKFTGDSIRQLVDGQLREGHSTIGDIARAIMESDRSLDIGSARLLAEVVVEALAFAGRVEMRGDRVYPGAGALT